MKLSEKIVELRKSKGLTQEELASICQVSRQSISKWEADIALPEIDKLLTLADIFQVSLDVLLKDELTVSGIKEVHTCGNNAVQEKKAELFEGVLIKESIEDESIIDYLTIHKVELWNTGGNPKYWTVLFFSTSENRFPELVSKVMISDEKTGTNWFVDFKSGNTKYIVFRNKVLNYQIGNQEEKEIVCNECRKMGITDEEMNWSE